MTETRVVCDKCNEEIKSGTGYFTLVDWYGSVEEYSPPMLELDLCSQGCLLKVLSSRCAIPRTKIEIMKILPKEK